MRLPDTRVHCHGPSLIAALAHAHDAQAKQKKQRTGDATAGGGAAAVKEGDVGDSSDGSDEEEELAGRGDLD